MIIFIYYMYNLNPEGVAQIHVAGAVVVNITVDGAVNYYQIT